MESTLIKRRSKNPPGNQADGLLPCALKADLIIVVIVFYPVRLSSAFHDHCGDS